MDAHDRAVAGVRDAIREAIVALVGALETRGPIGDVLGLMGEDGESPIARRIRVLRGRVHDTSDIDWNPQWRAGLR